MNRRTMLKTSVAAVGSFFLPSPRRHLDLIQFCARSEWGLYDLRLPYQLEEWTYATDSHICVRTRPQWNDTPQHRGKVPPFESLSWNHGHLRGWRSLPKLNAVEAADSECPECEGIGYKPVGKVSMECERCGGTGTYWVGNGWDLSVPRKCFVCNGKGHLPPSGCVVCRNCNGNAIGVFPSLVELHGRWFDARLYEKARNLDAEFVHDNWQCISRYPMLKIRFADGDGLLLGIEQSRAKERVRQAKL